jgi:hypothetical protein
MAFAGVTPARAATITFDDVTLTQSLNSTPNAWDDLPTLYAGMHWTGWEVMSGTACAANYPGCSPALPSTPNFAYGGNDTLTLTISDGLFIFSGADFADWPSASGELFNITITGYNGALQVGSLTVQLSDAWVMSGGIDGAIDRLEFTPVGVFRMDNATIDPAPEPATMGLLGIALVALGLLGKNRRKAR